MPNLGTESQLEQLPRGRESRGRSGAAPWLESLGQDIRLSARELRARPGFGVFVILTLALGIGATTAIFTVVNRVLLEPLPHPHPNRMVVLVQRSGSNSYPLISVPEYVMWRSETRIVALEGGKRSGRSLTRLLIPE
jgi:hypothetical protein